MSKWLQLLKNHNEEIVVLLIGNKTDLEKLNREVSTEEATKYALTNKLLFIETSASDSTNVEAAFYNILKEIYDKRKRLETKNRHVSGEYVLKYEYERQKSHIYVKDKNDNKCCNV